jgi:hypothetical protein|tara:strand:- start:48 stop:1187 length:1140 start_codon:yes stop_codon:yes gene_type:complete
MSEVKVNKLSPRSGTTVTIGDSGDTINVAGNTTITTTDNSDTLKLVSTDADATRGPVLVLHRDSGSPADNDVIGELQFAADSDAASETNFALLIGTALDVSHGSESGELDIQTRLAGTGRSRIKMNSTETIINDNSVNLDFRVESDGNANMFFVDGGNNGVGIGTSTLDAQVHILKTDSGALLDANADNLFLEDNTTGMTIGSSNTGEGHIRFSDSDDADVGAIGYFHSDNYMNFRADGAEVFRISDAGLHIGGTADANALDDYEEGTWTPTTNIGYANVYHAFYVKIGRLVFVHMYVQTNAGPGDSSQATSVSGLPFAAASGDIVSNNNIVQGLNQDVYSEIGGSSFSQRDRSDGTAITRSEYGSKYQKVSMTYYTDS